MKIALLSDIHANLEALDAVLEHLDSRHPGILSACLGDIVGYGPDPGACIDRLRERGMPCLRGNHEEMVLGVRDFSRCVADGITAARWTRRQLTDEQRGFIASLSIRQHLGGGLSVCHGDLDSADEYLSTAAAAECALAQLARQSPASWVLACGHTHQAAVYAEGTERFEERAAGTIALDGRRRALLNPGAVGQSRDGEPLAAYAVLDLAERRVDFHRITYDHVRTEQKMRRAGLPGGVVLLPPRGLQRPLERTRTRWARYWGERENRRLGHVRHDGT